MNQPFADKVVLVSGAASGISRVVLTRFLEAGAAGVIVDIDDDWGPGTAADLTAAGHRVIYQRTDVRDGAQVQQAVDAAVAAFGRVDILVHGAGVGVHKEIIDCSEEEWDLQIDVQLRGAFLLGRDVARQLVKQGEGGRIIFIGSTSGNNARPKSGPHAASKAAEIQLSKVMAQELGKYGITVNVVSPGLTDIGGISKSFQPSEYQKIFVNQVPLGRLGQPDEIADAVLFIASDQARFITGQALVVDGGYSAGKLSVSGPHEAQDFGQL